MDSCMYNAISVSTLQEVSSLATSCTQDCLSSCHTM